MPAVRVLRNASAHTVPIGIAPAANGSSRRPPLRNRIVSCVHTKAGCGKGKVRSMGRLNGYAAAIVIISSALLLAVCSCIEEPAPESRRPVPDIEGKEGGTAAQLYGADNWFAQERLAAVEADRDVGRAMAAFAADGYRFAQDGSFLIAGAAGKNQVEIALFCLSNTVHPERDVVYLAVIDTGRERGIAPARFSFARPLDETGSRPIADGVWLETLPLSMFPAGSAEAMNWQSQRWVWDEFWRCFDYLVIAGTYGCAISCIPTMPLGYMTCYFTCVGGVSLAAVVRCTMEQLFSLESSSMVLP